MRILKEFSPDLLIPHGVVCSWLYQHEQALYAQTKTQNTIYKFQNHDNRPVLLDYKTSKIAYNSITNSFLTISPYFSSDNTSIYICNEQFKKTDCITISLLNDCDYFSDIWFDENTNILWAASMQNIIKYNLNGDYLGNFMTAPKGTTYRNICTFNNFIFVAYEKKGCFFIASYTKEGGFLERINLGNEYNTCNMQVLNIENQLILRIYTVKCFQFQYFIDIELQTDNFKVDCYNDGDSSIITTCYIN